MEWEFTEIKKREFDKDFAIDGDLYCYNNGKLIFVGSSIPEDTKPSLIQKIKTLIWRKRTGGVVKLNRRTVEYIYNVCKGVMPSNKQEFVNCVMSTIPPEVLR